MKRFKSILFSPLADRGNPAAIRRVVELAGRNQAHLLLYGVVAEPPHRILHWQELARSALESERQSLSRSLDRWASSCGAEDAEVLIGEGNPALSIVERVVAADHDLVVVTSDEDQDDHVTIRRLLRKCPCPVWVIRPTRARIQRILAAVNPDPSEAALNRMILELAASMSEFGGGELHVAHAWELYGEATMRSSGFISTSDLDLEKLIAQEQDEHRLAMDELVSSAPQREAPWQIHLVKGAAADVIPALVTRHQINLLVMGTVARTGLRGLVMGNTAERVIDGVRCSVVAVKPPGFVSPIQHMS